MLSKLHSWHTQQSESSIHEIGISKPPFARGITDEMAERNRSLLQKAPYLSEIIFVDHYGEIAFHIASSLASSIVFNAPHRR
jgi:hypothetical protein